MVIAVLACGTPALGTDDKDVPAVWKTAYVKRGFVGDFKAEWAGGPGATLRMRTPLAVGGSQVKVVVQGSPADRVVVSRMALVRGKDDAGAVEGEAYPVTFDGKPTLTIERQKFARASDIMTISVTAGTWYVDDAYESPTFPYAYEVDAGWWRREGSEKATKLSARTGITRRIDVLTTDRRPLVVCYGDSITHGFGSTPNAAARYPDVLAKFLDQPTLNLGVNSDRLKDNGHAFLQVAELAGVEQVVFLLGINDIILRGVATPQEYAAVASTQIKELQKRKIRVIWGTIPPAGGFEQFDKDPAKEQFRQAVNEWIRSCGLPDAVADFDKAMADPENPTKLRATDHCGDWLHPNDAGYKRMAEAAAEAIKGMKAK